MTASVGYGRLQEAIQAVRREAEQLGRSLGETVSHELKYPQVIQRGSLRVT